METAANNEFIHLRTEETPLKKIRGSHEQRRTATYNKVISAGISILYNQGYQATTTTSVAEKAGVSRGALLHQFPTKTELIVGIAEYLVGQYAEARNDVFTEALPPLERFKRLTDLLWEKSKQENTIALIEIRLASRSDPELALGLKSRVNEAVRSQMDDACELAKLAGIEDQDAVKTLSTLTTASVWGLAILRLESSYQEDIEDAFELMKKNRDQLIEKLIK
ncbi:TetR/AcrR family transcriptional regulator [Aurantivibrio infirmus]